MPYRLRLLEGKGKAADDAAEGSFVRAVCGWAPSENRGAFLVPAENGGSSATGC